MSVRFKVNERVLCGGLKDTKGRHWLGLPSDSHFFDKIQSCPAMQTWKLTSQVPFPLSVSAMIRKPEPSQASTFSVKNKKQEMDKRKMSIGFFIESMAYSAE